eukprot:Rmarinus@m.24260
MHDPADAEVQNILRSNAHCSSNERNACDASAQSKWGLVRGLSSGASRSPSPKRGSRAKSPSSLQRFRSSSPKRRPGQSFQYCQSPRRGQSFGKSAGDILHKRRPSSAFDRRPSAVTSKVRPQTADPASRRVIPKERFKISATLSQQDSKPYLETPRTGCDVELFLNVKRGHSSLSRFTPHSAITHAVNERARVIQDRILLSDQHRPIRPSTAPSSGPENGGDRSHEIHLSKKEFDNDVNAILELCRPGCLEKQTAWGWKKAHVDGRVRDKDRTVSTRLYHPPSPTQPKTHKRASEAVEAKIEKYRKSYDDRTDLAARAKLYALQRRYRYARTEDLVRILEKQENKYRMPFSPDLDLDGIPEPNIGEKGIASPQRQDRAADMPKRRDADMSTCASPSESPSHTPSCSETESSADETKRRSKKARALRAHCHEDTQHTSTLTNFIRRNVKVDFGIFLPEFKQSEARRKKRALRDKQAIAKERRELLEEEKEKKLASFLLKKDARLRLLNKQRVVRVLQFWAPSVASGARISFLAATLEECRYSREVAAKERMAARVLQQWFRWKIGLPYHLKKFARAIRKIRGLLFFQAIRRRARARRDAVDKLKIFLADVRQINEFSVIVHRFRKRVVLLQFWWKAHVSLIESAIDVLEKLWDRAVEHIADSKKKAKKATKGKTRKSRLGKLNREVVRQSIRSDWWQRRRSFHVALQQWEEEKELMMNRLQEDRRLQSLITDVGNMTEEALENAAIQKLPPRPRFLSLVSFDYMVALAQQIEGVSSPKKKRHDM